MAAGQYRPHSAEIYAADASLELGAHGIVLRMVGRDKRVLELGCATGSVTKVLADRGCRVTAVEIDPDAAQQAKEWAEEVIVGDLDTLDLPAALGDATFDVILAADVLEHLRDPGRSLQACLERLSPGGEVVLSIPNVAHGDVRLALLQGQFQYQPLGLLDESHLRFFTRESLAQFLDDNQLIALEWDRVQVGVGGSEIAWDRSVDSNVLRWVIGQPDSDTYQFVLRAASAAPESHLRQVAEQRDAAFVHLVSAREAQSDAELAADLLRAQVAAHEADLEAMRGALEDTGVRLAAVTRERDDYKAAFGELAGVQDELVSVRRSESYRLGNALLSPVVSMRRLLRAWKRRRTLIQTMRPLSATVESVRPSWLWAGAVEPIVARGWAYHSRLPVAEVRGELGQTPVRAIATSIERDDVFDRFRDTPRRSANARRSGYLLAGLVGPLSSGSTSLEVSAVLGTGEVQPAGTVELPVRPFPRPALELTGSPDVAIAMATFNPPVALLETQVESIRQQTYTDWCCVVCDDGSSHTSREDIRDVLRGDPRFVFVENDERVGFYRNFERALALVPMSVRYAALADQDDRWHPGKLAELVRRLDADDSMQLVASDARLVDADGDLRSPTFYEHRVPTHDDPYSLFMVNSLIGASMLFRRDLLEQALPFPRAFDDVYHDHWLARVALARGTVGFVDEALYDYVQHGTNVLGSRSAQRWPMRELVKPYLRCRLGGNDRRLPDDWGAHFLTNVIEPQLAADLVRARWPAASRLRWLDRIAADSSYREIAQILVDHRREARADRLRREDVELVLFAGRAWAMEHQPADADVLTR